MTSQRLYTNADGGCYLEFDHHTRELRMHRNPGYTVSIPMDTTSMIRTGLKLAMTGQRIESYAASQAHEAREAAKQKASRAFTTGRCFEDGGRSWARDLLRALSSAEDVSGCAHLIEHSLRELAKVEDVANACKGAASVLAGVAQASWAAEPVSAAVNKPSRGGLFS